MSLLYRGAPAFAAVLCLVFAAPSRAADTSGSCVPLTRVQQRIVDKSREGSDALRLYVERTKIIYGIGLSEVADSLDAWQASSGCTPRVASAAAIRRTQ
jgi:hypothetical protein